MQQSKQTRDLLIFAAIFFIAVILVGVGVHTRASLIASLVNLGLLVMVLYMLKPYFKPKDI